LVHPDLRSTFSALRTVATQETVPSIAVLPFVNMSQDEENEYFADGLSEELLNVLAKIKGFRVASRTSARTFKGKEIDIPSAAQQLQVANVLAGSVRKAGKRVRISTQLVEAKKDETLWAETYDRELDDIFAVQDDIAQSVVKELRERLLGKPVDGSEAAKVIAEVQAASKGRSDNPEAYRLYLQGQFFRDQLNQDATARAVQCYQEALKLDPEYALALAGLSRAMSDLAGQKLGSAQGRLRNRPDRGPEGGHAGADTPRSTYRARLGIGMVRLELEGRGCVVPAGSRAGAGQYAGDQWRGDVLRQPRQPGCRGRAISPRRRP
jgi:TolB-like protein